jgi:hypothetical protein
MKASYDRMLAGNADDKKKFEAAFGTHANLDKAAVGSDPPKLSCNPRRLQNYGRTIRFG